MTCYRLYDCDIPELPLTIESYQGALVVADCRLPARADRGEDDDPARRDAWLAAMVEAARQAMKVGEGDVFWSGRGRTSSATASIRPPTSWSAATCARCSTS